MPDDSPHAPANGGNGDGSLEPAAVPLARRTNFRLGSATIRPSLRTVEGPAGRVETEPRVMQVLLAFCDAGGAVLTRDDLLRICWNGQVVGDDSINRAIAGVRRVAREAGAGFSVETIPRIGYRLKVEADETAAPASGGSAAGTSRRQLMVGGAAVLSAAGIAYWARRPSSSGSQAAKLVEESRIALRANAHARDRQAMALLERAIAIAPDSAEAWGLLALTRARADEHASPTSEVSPAAEIETAARRALALDRSNADAKTALAIAVPYYGDWLAAERRFDAVVAEHPDHPVARASRAFFYAAVGRMREGAEDRLVFKGDASFDANFQYGLIYSYWFLGRIEEADRVAARGMEMWPRNPGIWFGRLWLLADTGRFDRALAQIDDVRARPPLPPPMFVTLRAAMSAARSERPAEIDAASARVMAGVGRSVAAVVNGMMLLNLMRATDRAFDLARAYYLEQGSLIAAVQRQPGDPVVPDQRRRKSNMLFTPTAAAMQRDPRFPALMEAMGLADYWRKRGVVPDYRQT